MDATTADDRFIDWLFRAYVGTQEIHDLTPAEWKLNSLSASLLVLVNDHISAARVIDREQPGSPHFLVLTPARWAEVRTGALPVPDGLDRAPSRSWQRRPEHDETTTKLRQITLANFRCFEQTPFMFDPGLNVLIGRNGAGKSTVLDAIAAGLAGMIRPLQLRLEDASSDAVSFSRDVRVTRIDKGETTTFEPQFPLRIEAQMQFFGDFLQSGLQAIRQENGAVFLGSSKNVSFLDLADVVRWAVQDGFDVTLPLIAYYGTDRTSRGGAARPSTSESLSRLAGYEGCLRPSTDLSGMRAWFRRIELLALQDGRAPAVLEATKRAILACLDGFDLVRYDARLDDLAARSSTTGLLLAFEQLSDGQRNMLGMIADLAYRAATLNPHLGSDVTAQTPGVVLIDELDLHLHPAWQRRVLGDLTRVFPKVQFVVTTHSPQVLSTAPTGSVRLIDDDHRERRVDRTMGKDSNALLEDVLGVPERPPEVKAALEELARMIVDEALPEARMKLAEIAAILGEDDAEVTAGRWELKMAEGGDAAH
ncbi:MAG: AAA family ATPase [Minicystis sp.]